MDFFVQTMPERFLRRAIAGRQERTGILLYMWRVAFCVKCGNLRDLLCLGAPTFSTPKRRLNRFSTAAREAQSYGTSRKYDARFLFPGPCRPNAHVFLPIPISHLCNVRLNDLQHFSGSLQFQAANNSTTRLPPFSRRLTHYGPPRKPLWTAG